MNTPTRPESGPVNKSFLLSWSLDKLKKSMVNSTYIRNYLATCRFGQNTMIYSMARKPYENL
jgi:hypothetical protein